VSDVSSRFRDFLLADENIARLVGGRVHEDHVPQRLGAKDYPFIWFQKRAMTSDLLLTDPPGAAPSSYTFDIECTGRSHGTVKQLSEYVRARLHGWFGEFGDDTVQLIRADDQAGEYTSRSSGGDSGLFTESLIAEVYL